MGGTAAGLVGTPPAMALIVAWHIVWLPAGIDSMKCNSGYDNLMTILSITIVTIQNGFSKKNTIW
jgi:hypothetical protein